jgi:hypothetical protein
MDPTLMRVLRATRYGENMARGGGTDWLLIGIVFFVVGAALQLSGYELLRTFGWLLLLMGVVAAVMAVLGVPRMATIAS